MKKWSVALLPLLLCGCLEVKDYLTLQPDGSGTIHMEVQSDLSSEFFQGMGMSAMGRGRQIIYPPVSESEAKIFFPTETFSVTAKQEDLDSGGTKVVIDAAFKDINALLSSSYGTSHMLHVATNNGKLIVKAKSGMTIPVRVSEHKDATRYMGEVAEITAARTNRNKMKFEFRLTLPGAVDETNGTRDGNSVTWTRLRASSTNVEEFVSQLETVMEVSCDAAKVTFSPITLPRLGLLPFKDLAPGVVTLKEGGVDTNKVQEAAKFVPYALHINRSVDLSGEGGAYDNQAQLFGAVVVPIALAPQKWGKVDVQEVVDNAGNSLKSDDSDYSWSSSNWGRDEFEDPDSDEPPKPKIEERHPITLQFEPPEWQAKEIARIKAVVPLHYFSGAQVIKLTNAVPAKWIMDTSSGSYSYDGSEKLVNDAQLIQMGVKLSVQSAMAQGPMTVVTFEVEGAPSVSEFQIFDAEGVPWPTASADFGATESHRQVVVYGQPKAPLSLALLVGDKGATVNVPILMEKIPLQKRTVAKGETAK